MRFKKSTFTYPFSHNGLYYVVQTYTKKLFEIDKRTFDAILAYNEFVELSDSQTIGAFKDAQIIEPTVTVDKLELECKSKDHEEEWHSLHIIPTASCNFACPYCFVLKDKRHHDCDGVISNENLRKGIDFFFDNNPSNQVIVTFYGGEPLLAPDVIYRSVDYIENKLKRKISKKIITNGSLITPSIAMYLSEHDFDVNISLDGNKSAQDAFRLYKNGTSTFDDVIDGIKILKEYGNSIKILMTVGDFNAPYLIENVKELLQYNPTTIALNLPKALQYGSNGIEGTIDYDELLSQYLKCIELCYQARIPEGHMADIIYGFLRDEVQYKPCHGCGKQIALTPDGMVGPCQAYLGTKKYFSSLKKYPDKKTLRSNDAFKKWNEISMYRCEQCRKCFLLPVCPGDCPYDWENRCGSLFEVPDSYCLSRKTMFDYMIKRKVSGKSILFRPEISRNE